MNVSVLLRILPPSRTGGRLAGRAEVIETGETRLFADHDEMLAFLHQVATSTPAEMGVAAGSWATDAPGTPPGGSPPAP